MINLRRNGNLLNSDVLGVYTWRKKMHPSMQNRCRKCFIAQPEIEYRFNVQSIMFAVEQARKQQSGNCTCYSRHTYTHIYTHTRTHTYTHTHARTYTRAHTHTRTR